MSAVSSELVRLFTELALAARCPNAGARHGAAAASTASLPSLVASFKPKPDASSGSSILDAALSLMCFRSPQVYDSTIDSIVKTMVSVLLSSISCKVDRLDKKDAGVLRLGSSISSADREKLLRVCIDVVGSLKGHGLCQSLIHAALKASAWASDCQSLFPMSRLYYEKTDVARESGSSVVLELESLLPVETSVNEHEITQRLLLWYLNPLLLKDAISNLLRETVHRPFLCLQNEFHERMAWRVLIICLVISPTLFKQTRMLLHKWFLVTGLASVLELQTALVSSLLDVLSRPMWWDLSMELGLKLPFSHAYFPTSHGELLASLTGSISCESFLNLVSMIQMPLAPTAKNVNPIETPQSGISHQSMSNWTRIDYNSTWAMLMNFPSWFYFATVLIFFEESSQGGFLTNLRSRAVEAESKISNVMEVRHAAAKYLAFILSPLDEDSFNLCFNLVTEISLSWGMKVKSDTAYEFLSLETSLKNACVYGKKLRKTKAPDTQKTYITSDGHEGASTELWLRQFQKYYDKFRAVFKDAPHEGRTIEIVDTRSSMLFTRISLGILLCCIGNLDERECSRLLNYAATGEIVHIQEIQILKREESRKEMLGTHGYGDPILLSSSCESEWAFRGAALLFDLSACIEEICTVFCGSDDEMMDFICLVKGKTCNYLLKCIREVLSCAHHDKDEGRSLMLKDLSMRLERWRKLGREVFEGCAAFSDILDDLNRRLGIAIGSCTSF